MVGEDMVMAYLGGREYDFGDKKWNYFDMDSHLINFRIKR